MKKRDLVLALCITTVFAVLAAWQRQHVYLILSADLLVVLGWIVFCLQRNRQHSIASVKLLDEGHINNFVERMDVEIRQFIPSPYRNMLIVNRMAGLCYLDRCKEVVEVLEHTSTWLFHPMFKLIYLNNMLFALCMSDAERARAFITEHGETLRNHGKKAVERFISGTLRMYSVLVEDDNTLKHELANTAQDSESLPAKSTNLYLQARCAWLEGDADSAANLMRQANELSPECLFQDHPENKFAIRLS